MMNRGWTCLGTFSFSSGFETASDAKNGVGEAMKRGLVK
jgi:hypothetical protein